MDGKQNSVLKNSPYCRRVIVLSLLTTGISVGNVFTSLNPLVGVIYEVFNSTYNQRNGEYPESTVLTTLVSFTVSMPTIGAFFGSLSAGHILKILSRKQTMILSNCLIILGHIIVSAGAGPTGSYEAFIIGRFFSGLASGLVINTFPVVVAELCARQYQQKFQSVIGLSLAMGMVLGPVISHPQILGGRYRWPWAIAFGCLPSLIYLCSSPWCPDTPYTLLRKHKRAEALKTLRKLRVGSQESINYEIEQIEKEQSGFRDDKIKGNEEEVTPEKINYLGIKAILQTPIYRFQFFIVLMFYCGLMLSGVNHVIFYSNEIFKSAGIPDDIVTYVTIGVFVLQAFASLVGIKLIALYGARKLVLVAIGCCGISHIITTIGLVTSEFSTYSGYFSIVGILVYLVSFSAGPNIGVFALAADVTIEPTRQTVLNYAAGCMWLIAWLVGFCAPYMDASMHGYSFLVWCGFTIVTWILIFWLVPETKGRTMEEIQRDLAK